MLLPEPATRAIPDAVPSSKPPPSGRPRSPLPIPPGSSSTPGRSNRTVCGRRIQVDVPVSHLGRAPPPPPARCGKWPRALIKSPNLHQRADRDIERAFAFAAVIHARRKQLEQLRRNLDRPLRGPPVDLAPFAFGLVVRKQIVQPPHFIERGIRRRLPSATRSYPYSSTE